MPSTIDYSNQQYRSYNYGFCIYGQQQSRSREDYMMMLVEQTDKLLVNYVSQCRRMF
jgi:hypothetical protein